MAYSLNELNNRLHKLIVIMKKEEIYVSVESKEQAEIFRKVLEAMGEVIDKNFCHGGEEIMKFYLGKWLCGFWNVSTEEKITFGELIDLLQRKPLLISEDGVPLYGDEDIFMCWIDSNTGKAEYKKSYFIPTCNYTSKIFISESKALEWIEEQKPKEIIIDLDKNELSLEAHCTKKSVSIFYTGKHGNPISFTKNCIDKIYNAMEELKNV